MSSVANTRFRLALATIVLSFVVQTAMAGQVLNVPSSGLPSISQALIKARQGDTVLLANGVYKEHLYVKEGVTVKAKTLHKARVDGGGRGTVITLGTNSRIEGLEIANGTIGVFSRNPGTSISRCMIISNWLTGVMAVRHLPKIEDNIVAFNRSSGFQLWDVRSTKSSINHNTIAYNGNHGIAIGGQSSVVIEHNVIAYNERYGLKSLPDTTKCEIVRNNFYSNLHQPVPKGNFAFDPAFTSAKVAMDFRPDPKLCCSVKGSDNENLGARFDF